MPQELSTGKILVGKGVLKKESFYEDNRLGLVTFICLSPVPCILAKTQFIATSLLANRVV